jgi:Flavodoxin-like fold
MPPGEREGRISSDLHSNGSLCLQVERTSARRKRPVRRTDLPNGAQPRWRELDHSLSQALLLHGHCATCWRVAASCCCVVRAGRTFRYTETGPVCVAGAKKVIIVSSRAGMYAGTPHEAAMDHQEAYLRTILNFIGVTDVTYVHAEGVAISPEKRREAIASAERDIAHRTLATRKPPDLLRRIGSCQDPGRDALMSRSSYRTAGQP